MPKVSLKVGGVRISEDDDCFVIAEIGHNHQGNVDKCIDLFVTAKLCGAHAVKLQKRNNRALFTKEMYDSPYDNRNSYGHTYGEHREALEFGKKDYQLLQKKAKELGIIFFSTAFDIPSADFLADLDMPAYKVASGDVNNLPLIEYIARLQKPIFLSTGGAQMADVERAYETVMAINPQLCIMQCTSGYPAEFSELNLNVIRTFRERFPDIVIGLSSHDNGIAMAAVGYAMGACAVEKHFTLNRASKGTDHPFSLEPDGLRKMIRDLRRVHQAMGDGVKRQYPSEKSPLYKMGKKVVAARPLSAGHVIRARDLTMKSPNDGLPPTLLGDVVGQKLVRVVAEDQNIEHGLASVPSAGKVHGPAKAKAKPKARAKRTVGAK